MNKKGTGEYKSDEKNNNVLIHEKHGIQVSIMAVAALRIY